MKRLKISELPGGTPEHFLTGLIPGRYLRKGALGYKKPGQRTHDVGCSCASCDGEGHHVHADDREVFIIVQGKAVMELDGQKISMVTGDVLIVDPGEDHHLVADTEDPCINLWLHAGSERHPEQMA